MRPRRTSTCGDCLVAAFSAVGLIVSSSPMARADWFHKLVTTRCMPEVDLFQIHTYGKYNIVLNDAKRARLAKKGAIFPNKEGVIASCKVYGRTLALEVTSYKPSEASRTCGGDDFAEGRLLLDGQPFVTLGKLNGWCFEGVQHFIDADSTGITHCTTVFDSGSYLVDGMKYKGPVDLKTTCARHSYDARAN
jgi:hypothetical protein